MFVVPPAQWGWATFQNIETLRWDIVPLCDTRVHQLGEGCWCGASLDPDGDLVHNAADRRERYERGDARMH